MAQSSSCAGATTLPVNPAGVGCAPVNGTLAGFSNTGKECSGGNSRQGFYQFTATSTSHLVGVTGSSLFDAVVNIGTSCANLNNTVFCFDNTLSGGIERILFNTVIGTTYFVSVRNFNNVGATDDFTICVNTPTNDPVIVPPNDNCNNAVLLTQTAFGVCNGVVGTLLNATNSPQAEFCPGTAANDVWYSFVATATIAYISVNNLTGNTTDIVTGLYGGGSCGGGFTAAACIDTPDAGGRITSLVIGDTYFVRISTFANTLGQTTAFNICVTQPPPPITNNECTGATVIVVPPLGSGCNSAMGTIIGATGSAQANTCPSSGSANDDVWFSFVATNTSASIGINDVTGSTNDMFHSIYAGTCGAIGAPILCSDPNTSIITGLTVGNTYFVRVYTFTATTGQTSTFNLCITSTPVCGNLQNNDYCSNPAILTIGAGDFSSSTTGIYSSDTPANTSAAFCGTIENNSWYQFTATLTTHIFNFTAIGACTYGVQAQVYQVTRDANGCCTNLTSRSNCFNPTFASNGVVTATGLIVGAQYIIMIDGYVGAQCNFTVSGWTAVGILPVDLLTFTGIALPNGNKLAWETIAERNNKQFEIQKSTDITNWETIGTVAGAGTSETIKSYSFVDTNVKGAINYYRLKQIDKNGEFKYSNIVSIKNGIENTIISAPRPNPATSFIEIDISTQNAENIDIKVVDILGRTLINQTKLLTNGFQTANINIEKLNNGYYTIIITNNTDTRKVYKFVKLD